MILQRSDLAPSIARGPRALAAVRGIGINEDGKTKSLTYPSPEAQAGLIKDVIKRYGLDPDQFVFLEAHGTGTQVGDKVIFVYFVQAPAI